MNKIVFEAVFDEQRSEWTLKNNVVEGLEDYPNTCSCAQAVMIQIARDALDIAAAFEHGWIKK